MVDHITIPLLLSPQEHDFAAAWRSQPKWVASRTLKSVGPNATLVEDDIEAVIRGLKAQAAEALSEAIKPAGQTAACIAA